MQILMDDAGDLPAELAQKHDVEIIPINIMFGTEQYLSGIEMDHAKFYDRAKTVEARSFPKTSQPTPYQFVQKYKEILARGENEIYTVTVGQKLSGTYASATQAAHELDGKGTFHIFDSQAATAAQGFMAIEAARLAREGASAEAINARLQKMVNDMVVIFTIDSLEYAVKGGRVSSLKSVMASLLNIKPIMRLEDGVVVEAGRVRTRKRAISHIVDTVHQGVGNQPVQLAVIHANSPADAAQLRQQAEATFNIHELMTVDMAVAVAINLGPGALGLIAIPV
ncbi:MAG: DegV family protein [Chloroflexota bacterium]